VTREAEDEVAELYSVLSRRTTRRYPDKHQAFDDFLQQEMMGWRNRASVCPDWVCASKTSQLGVVERLMRRSRR
jgi:hypothetical protein